ncbi:MAG TPA: (2Fe-2S) ferredoxin domain-containing protein [Chryseosolibacter sp.]|nr:(2Fe-2S) ferredoxin domain-containing protein [Chryseosolibacter sp.]
MSKNRLEKPACVIYACCGSKCKKRGGKQLFKDLRSIVKESKHRRQVQVIKTGCTDRCKFGPIVAVMPENTWHFEVDTNKVANIVDDSIRRIQNTTDNNS